MRFLPLFLLPSLFAADVPLYQRFLSPASPQEVVAARKADRVAWVDYAEGKRNAYTAAAPAFTPVKLTNFPKDDGIMMSEIKISDDGSTVVFLRGEAPNREGWAPNPTANPDGPEHAIWAARTSGGSAWRVVDAANPEIAPDGSSILYIKDGQIYRAKLSPAEASHSDKPFIKEWGVQSDPKWSPDGRKIAWVSTRIDHSFIMVYDVATRTVKYMSPGVDFDTLPMWTADSKHLVFMRTPGLPFGQLQLQIGPGSGAIYSNQGTAPAQTPPVNNTAGMNRSTFKGGYTIEFYKADATTGDAALVWHNQQNDPVVSSPSNIHLAGDYLVFQYNAPGTGRGGRGGGRGGRGNAAGRGNAGQDTPLSPEAEKLAKDEWERLYSIHLTDASARPVLLTTTDGLIENQTSIAVSPDGKTLYYCTNTNDIERRHIWTVPVSGGTPAQITTGEGVETSPAPLASGKYLATLSADWNLPQSLGVWKTDSLTAAAPPQKIVFPASMPGFPKDLHVKPQIIITHADDGVEVHNQLFLPKDLKPGERRPAIVFVHGGPPRQMMPAYHYMQFYHWAYGINQWLANQGYIVMSVNYRLGVGYGRSFRTPEKAGAQGNSEYKDVLAGGKYLQSRPDVDPNRVGIWGLSYGGLLTSEALARNSDLFKAGVDMAGVHLEGNSLDPNSVSYQSSAISQIDKWKSPVLLVHGDDDRNVAFLQTVGLVQLLRQRDVYYELLVFPDDVHESLLHSRWLYTLGRMETFLHRFLWEKPSTSSNN